MRRLQSSSAPVLRAAIAAMVLSALGAAAAYDRMAAADNRHVAGEVGTIVLSPKDTYLNTNKRNYGTSTTLPVYTWPDNKIANAILMKFDLSTLPAGAVVTGATLHLALVASDPKADSTYTVTAHKVIRRNPNILKATGYTADGVVPWTANNCCYGGAPLAQADITPAYDTKVINKVKEFKTWNLTTMVQEWMLNPATNFGVLLDGDASKLRDRYREFASMEHATASLRPYLTVTFVAADVTPPSVAITTPAAGDVSGVVGLTATATDNVAVAGVQYQLNGAALSPELLVPPYASAWDTSTLSDGNYVLTAVARDAFGNSATSAAVNVSARNGVLYYSPQDTYMNLDTNNYSAETVLRTYTWPDFKMANAILMRFDLSSMPAGAVVDDATLFMTLVESDALAAGTYNISASKILGRNPVVAQATGYQADAATAWTPSACCSNGVPLAQGDISAPYTTLAVDKTTAPKAWTITGVVQEWVADPSTNFGLVLNSDASKPRDHYRVFASMEHANPAMRPVLRISYSLSADTTPPTFGAVSASDVTASTAVINWTTDEGSTSQVEYGPSAYGNLSPLSSALVTSHSVMLSGLSESTVYHFRVLSRDQTGNLAASGDFLFTTLDGRAPSVSVTAPAAGATVSGTISVTADATDNAGVAAVQFTLDGANLGVEDGTAPYSTSWNTTGVPNGSHTLTAVARDAAGNVTNSTPVIITVSNAVPPPPPPPAGIAANYPGDAGIETNADVLFVERFNESAMSNVFGRWTDVLNGAAMSLSTDAPVGSPVGRSLTIPWSSGNTGGHLYRRLPQGVDDTLYVRYYVKYPASGYDHTGIWMGGYNPPLDWPNPQAGVKPAGNDRFIAAAEQNELNRFDHYNYWMGMHQSGDGNFWGNYLLNNPAVQATAGQWMCVEHMVKLNNPVSAANGEHAIWINGTKVSHVGEGFPKGSWSGGIFTQDPAGTAFPGLQWRNSSSLNLNWIWLQVYSTTGSGNLKYAHVVAAKSYIGCLASGSSSDTTAPTVSVTSPVAGAALSGTVTVAATAVDNVGVAGVQFKLNGSNLGAEDTSSPFSLSWDTTSVPNGGHTLTAVARDAAGNQTNSAPITVSVNNTSTGTALFSSNWDTASGTSTAAVTDGGRWPNYWEFNNGTGVQLLSVVPGGVNGHNALRVQQRGSSFAANLQIDNVLPQSQDYYLRYYMMNNDTSGAGDHIVTADTYNYANLTYMRKSGGAANWSFVISLYGCGYTYPIGHWGPSQALANGQWYRFEYFVDYVDATHVQVHPRVYDVNGNLVLSDADFRQSDFGGASWNGKSDWTLASFYAAGHSFCVNPAWMNDFGLGNNGQFGAGDTGQYWYFSAVEIRTDRWPGPVQ